jgi:hypothetical protein
MKLYATEHRSPFKVINRFNKSIIQVTGEMLHRVTKAFSIHGVSIALFSRGSRYFPKV